MKVITPLCNGCHACFSVCPKNSISMVACDEGFLSPVIDNTICIDCGLCRKICPVLNPLKRSNEDAKAYIIINRDEEIRKTSSSGGIFTALAQNIINNNGVVFGAIFNKNFEVVHSYTETIEELKNFRGSKYLQSKIGSSYKDCKNFLNNGRLVMFTGTPCQIAGLKAYLRKDYDNLLLVDFICHGVPSPLLWEYYKKFREKQASSSLKEATFRDKSESWGSYSLSMSFQNTKYKEVLYKDPYMRIFLRNVCLRKSCYNCSYKGTKRISDITMADFWGIEKIHPEYFDNKGTSFVTVHSNKGKEALDSVHNCLIKEIPLEHGANFNPSMVSSVAMPKARLTFYKDLTTKPFKRIIAKYSKDPLYRRLLSFIKRCTRKLLRLLRGRI